MINNQLLQIGFYYWAQIHQRFFARFFRTNVVSAAFSSYVLALSKISYEKCARKTLMKLTPGLKFTCTLPQGVNNFTAERITDLDNLNLIIKMVWF